MPITLLGKNIVVKVWECTLKNKQTNKKNGNNVETRILFGAFLMI